MRTILAEPPVAARPLVGRHVIGRDGNVVRVDFDLDPDPPAPRFPGAGALRPCEILPVEALPTLAQGMRAA